MPGDPLGILAPKQGAQTSDPLGILGSPKYDTKPDVRSVMGKYGIESGQTPQQSLVNYGQQISKDQLDKRNEAINNTIALNDKNTGTQTSPNSPDYQKSFQDKVQKIGSGDLKVVTGTKDGKPYLVKTTGFWKTAGDAFLNSFKEIGSSHAINSKSGKELADYIEKENANQPNIPESVPSPVAGAFGEAAGGFPKIAGELSIPYVGEVIAAADAQLQSSANKTRELYFENKAKGMSPEEAANRARMDAPFQALPDAAMMVAMNRIGMGEESNVAAKTFANTLKQGAKSTGELAALSGAAEGAKAGIGALQGYDTNGQEVLDNIGKASFSGATLGAMFSLIPMVKNMSSPVKAAYKNYFTTMPKEVLEAGAAKFGEDGQKFVSEVESFNSAKEKVKNLVPEKDIPSYAGLQEKRDQLSAQLKQYQEPSDISPALQENAINIVKQKIDAIDKQIGKMQKSGNPLDHEVDSDTGLKLGEAHEIETPQENATEIKEEPQAEVLPQQADEGAANSNEPIASKESGVTTGEVNKNSEGSGKIETDKAVMDGVKTGYVENENGDKIKLPSEGFLIDGVYLKEGNEKGKGSGQELYKKALEEHGTLYSHWPVSEDALRVQDKLVEKGISKVENIKLSDGTELRKITKVEPVNAEIGKGSEGTEFKPTETKGNSVVGSNNGMESKGTEHKGFTEGKDSNKIYSDLKQKYGDKKGAALYEVANRLVNPNENTIIEIRGNGVVVKEGDKYILKPFGNTDANPKKWTLYKGMDITNQFPKSESLLSKEQTPENISQNKTQGVNNATTEPEIKNEEPPIVAPEKTTVEETGSEDNSSGGIAQRIREKRAETTGVLPSEIGKGWNKENALARGRELIANGTDPYKLIKQFKKDGKLSADDMAVFQAHAIELQRATDRAADSEDNKAYEDALFKENDFLDDVKKAQTEWSKTGIAQQGEYNFDAESFNSIKRAKAAKTGKPQADLPPEIKQASEHVKKLEEQNKKLQSDLEEALNKKAKETDTAKKKTYTEKAKKVADTFRKLKTKPFIFKDENGNTIDIQKMGISWNDLVELGAKAIEKTGEIADGVAEILDKIKDAEWYMKLSANDKEKLEKQLQYHYEDSIKNTPEAKNIKRLEKQLEDLQQGIARQSDAVKRKLTEREKELQDQIFEAKKNLGLIASKKLPEVKVDKTAEQKKLDRLNKELEDLQKGKVRQQSIPTEDTQAVKDLKDKIFEEKQKLGLISSKGKIPKPNYGLSETVESKNIRRLEKELDDARNGIFKDKTEKRTPSQIEKDLQDQIFEEKKKAGLIRSKAQSIRETDFGLKITAEEKRIEALQKQKDDLENGIVKQNGGNKLNPTPEQKAQIDKLNDDIAELKKNLGLTRSRMAKPEDEITPEERNIDRLNAELERLKSEQKLKGKPDKRELTDEEKDIQKQIETEQDKIKYNNLVKEFANKKDNTFTAEQSANIWDYTKKAYIEPNPNYHVRDMVNGVAMDLGLKPEQVRSALGQTPETRRLSDQIYRTNYEKNKAKRTIQNWVNKTDDAPVNKFLDTISAPFRSLATLGHGHALLFTHAGMNLFDPQTSKAFIKAAANQFKLVYGKESNYAKAAEDLKAEPLYTEAVRAGAGVDPDTVYDDWQLATNFLKRLKLQGNKGFLVLKMMRMELFKNEYNNLSAIEKADPKVLKQIAINVNHWTGTSGINVNPLTNAFIFAPNLIVSKFARLTSDPLKAINVLQKQIRGKEVSLEDKAAAKIIAKKTGRTMATYVGALIANQAMLSLVGSKQKVNMTNPMQSDWLEFKTGDEVGAKTIDVSSGMTSTMQFLMQLASLPFASKKDVGTDYYGAKSADEATQKEVTGFLRRSLSPFGSVVYDIASHKDYAGNVLPFYEDKPTGNKEKLTPLQYGLEKIPIPLAETFKTIHDEMVAEGVDKPTAEHIIGGILIGAIASGGVKVGNAPKERPTPFTEEDNKDPTFKYFLDKGMSLPNTSLQYEKVTDEESGTKKSVSDYPQATQDQYQKVHKSELKNILSEVVSNKVVYIKMYKDGKGKVINEIHIDEPSGNYKEVQLSKLTQDELAQVLKIAQSQATKNAKQEVFKSDDQ